jgi:hypothetical protein
LTPEWEERFLNKAFGLKQPSVIASTVLSSPSRNLWNAVMDSVRSHQAFLSENEHEKIKKHAQ